MKFQDAFKLNNAPTIEYIDGNGKERKAYSEDAYTEDYMLKSDDTNRLIRWVVELDDGRKVSIQSYFKIVKGITVIGNIGKKNAARKIWDMMTSEERDSSLVNADIKEFDDFHKFEMHLKNNKHWLLNCMWYGDAHYYIAGLIGQQ